MELRDYLQSLRHNWRLIVATSTLGILSAFAIFFFVPATYVSSSDVFVYVQPSDHPSGDEVAQNSNFVIQAMSTYTVIAKSDTVLAGVIRDLGLKTTPAKLSETVSATSPATSAVLRVSVQGNDPKRIAAIANSVVANFSRYVALKLDRSPGSSSAVKFDVLGLATVPESPANASLLYDLTIGLLLGVLVGVLSGLARSRFHQQDPTMHQPIVGDAQVSGTTR